MTAIDRNLFAYYSPKVGTVSVNYFFDPSHYAKTGTSLPSQLLVGSDFSQQVLLFSRTGELVWSTYSYGRAFTYHDGALYAAVNQAIANIDMTTGAICGVYDLGGAPQFINSSGDYIVAGVRPSGQSSDAVVKVFRADNALWNQSPLFSFSIGNGYSRDAELSGQQLIVADTFNHNVKVYDVENGSVLYEGDFYFPNDIAVINDSEFLVAEEHGNRLWSVNWVTGTQTLVMSSPSSLYADPSTTVERIQAEQSIHVTELPGLLYPIGNSAVEIAGEHTLYSPNGVVLAENGFIVADTDNHRVLLIRDNEIKAVLSGINNPIHLQLLNDRPAGPEVIRVDFTADGKARLDLAAYTDPNSDELSFRLT